MIVIESKILLWHRHNRKLNPRKRRSIKWKTKKRNGYVRTVAIPPQVDSLEISVLSAD
jgi:hypothetical protein